MKTTQELVAAISEKFNDSLNRATGSKIISPFMVIYSGDESSAYDHNLMAAFRQQWKAARAEKICRAVRKNNEYIPIKDGFDGIAEYVNEMFLCSEEFFVDFRKMTAVVIYDSRDFDSPEALTAAYETDIEKIKRDIRENASVVRFVLLDNSRDMREYRNAVKKYLVGQMGAEKSSGTFLLSNQLHNGRTSTYSDLYDLIGKFISVGCADHGFDGSPDLFGIFSKKSVSAISYTKMERPNVKISAIIVQRYIEWINNYYTKNAELTEKDISARLGLATNSGFGITNDIYEKIKGNFPDTSALRYLPMSRPLSKELKLENTQFSQFDTNTMNGFKLFYNDYYMPVISNKNTETLAADLIKKLLNDSFTQPEILGFNDTVCDKVRTLLNNAVRAPMQATVLAQYLDNYNKANIERHIVDMIVDEVKKKKNMAQQQLELIRKLRNDFFENIIVDESSDKDNIGFYAPLVDAYLKENGEAFVNESLNDITEFSTALRKIYEHAVEMIENVGKFKLPFEDELREKSTDKNGIYSTIRDAVLANSSDNIYLGSLNVTPDPLFRIIMMNQKDVNGANTALYCELYQSFNVNGQNQSLNYILNNGNLNGITALQVFPLTDTALM